MHEQFLPKLSPLLEACKPRGKQPCTQCGFAATNTYVTACHDEAVECSATKCMMLYHTLSDVRRCEPAGQTLFGSPIVVYTATGCTNRLFVSLAFLQDTNQEGASSTDRWSHRRSNPCGGKRTATEKWCYKQSQSVTKVLRRTRISNSVWTTECFAERGHLSASL